MTGSRHDHPHDLLGPAALGVITKVEQQQLDRHLRGCAQCREEMSALTGVAGRLGALEPEDVLTMDLASSPARTDAVLAAVARANAGQHRRAQWTQSVLAAAASVAVLIAGLVTAGALDGRGTDPVPLEAVAVASQDGVQASADLVPHTWGVEIKLEATGLPVGQPYTVEVTSTTGQVTDAGAFLGTGDATLLCNLNASVLRPDAQSFAVLDDGGRPVLTANF